MCIILIGRSRIWDWETKGSIYPSCVLWFLRRKKREKRKRNSDNKREIETHIELAILEFKNKGIGNMELHRRLYNDSMGAGTFTTHFMEVASSIEHAIESNGRGSFKIVQC